jgi:hypothetical protein
MAMGQLKDVRSERDIALDTMLDKLALADLTARWCRGVDRADVELIQSCYHPDGVDDHGSWRGTGFDFAPWIVGVIHDTGIFHHSLGQQLFEIEGDIAFGESYCIFHNTPPTGRPMHAWCRYVDRFERRAGEWKISARTVVTDWIGFLDDTGHQNTTEAGWVTSRSDRSDPVYMIRKGPIR